MIFLDKIKSIAPFFLYCCLLTWWVSDHCFFWDTVQLASKQAHWYYDHNFKYFLLPEIIDSGHPPFFGIYLAGLWTLFGKSLLVSHFSLLPFLVGIVWLLQEIGIYFGNLKSSKYLIALVLIDPFFAGQSVLVSPDIVLIFAFLLGVYSILYQRVFCLVIANIFLALVSLRGMMVCFSLYGWWVLITLFQAKKPSIIRVFFQKLPAFLPAGCLALLFLGIHYQATGWIGYHPDSPWTGSFERVNFAGLLKNIGILTWRFLDYGRLFLWGGIIWIFLKKRAVIKEEKIQSLFLLLGILFLLLTPSLLLHKGLLNHRYLLPITLIISLVFYRLVFQIITKKSVQKWVFSIAFLGLLAGNCWVYPKKIAQGWDATLAHLPYYHLRKKMIDFIDVQQIPYNEISTVFPNIGPFEIYDLNGRQEGFVKKDFKANSYVFYSTVFNDFSEEELEELTEHWRIVQKYEAFGIQVILYEQ